MHYACKSRKRPHRTFRPGRVARSRCPTGAMTVAPPAEAPTAPGRLDGVAELLKRFRQAVLAPTSGEMTREWRATQDSWSTIKTKEAGKIQLGRQRSPKYHHGPTMRPYLRVQNVFEDRIDLDDVMEMDFSGADLEKYTLHPGDILLNEGQSPQYLGRPAMYRGEPPGACFTNSLIRFQAGDSVLAEFALLVFRESMHSGRYVGKGTITTNIAHLSSHHCLSSKRSSAAIRASSPSPTNSKPGSTPPARSSIASPQPCWPRRSAASWCPRIPETNPRACCSNGFGRLARRLPVQPNPRGVVAPRLQPTRNSFTWMPPQSGPICWLGC